MNLKTGVAINDRTGIYIINFLYLFTSIVLGLVLIKFHGYETRGQLSIIQATGQTLASLSTIGLPASATYYLKKDKIFSESLFVSYIITALVLFLMLYLFRLYIQDFLKIDFSYLFLYILCISLSGIILNGFISLGLSAIMVIFYIIQNIIILTYIIYEKIFELHFYLEIYISSSIVILILVIMLYWKYFSFKSFNNLKINLKYFSYGLKNYPLSIMNALTKKIDVMVVAYFFDLYNLGFYSLMSNIRELSNYISRLSANFISKKIFKDASDANKILRILNSEIKLIYNFNLIVIIFGVITIPLILNFIGKSYANDTFYNSIVMYILLISYFPNSKSYLLSIGLISLNQNYKNFTSMMYSALVFIMLLFFCAIFKSMLLVAVSILISTYVSSKFFEFNFRSLSKCVAS